MNTKKQLHFGTAFLSAFCILALVACAEPKTTPKSVTGEEALSPKVVEMCEPLVNESKTLPSACDCSFVGETSTTTLEQHLEYIKQAFKSKELSTYLVSCGSFIGNERYYLDLLTPIAQVTLNEIRTIKEFKTLSLNLLLSTDVTNPNFLKLIDVNGNFRNDKKVTSHLVSLLRSEDHEIRMGAAGALKGTTSPSAIAQLIKMTKSSDAITRFAAAVALEGTSVAEARIALMKLRNDPDTGVRAQALLGTL